MTLAAGSLLSPSVFELGRRALARESTSQPLIRPSELRSVNGILEATITAACGPVRLGDHEFTGMLYNGSYRAADAASTPRRYAADHVPQRSD